MTKTLPKEKDDQGESPTTIDDPLPRKKSCEPKKNKENVNQTNKSDEAKTKNEFWLLLIRSFLIFHTNRIILILDNTSSEDLLAKYWWLLPFFERTSLWVYFFWDFVGAWTVMNGHQYVFFQMPKIANYGVIITNYTLL